MTTQTKPEPVQCEIAIAMNEDGDWIVVHWEDDAVDEMTNGVGFKALRIAKLIVTMTPPAIPEVEVTIPDEAGETVHAESEEAA